MLCFFFLLFSRRLLSIDNTMLALNTFVRNTCINTNVLSSTLLNASARSLFSRRMNHIKAEEAREFTIQLPVGRIAGNSKVLSLPTNV